MPARSAARRSAGSRRYGSGYGSAGRPGFVGVANGGRECRECGAHGGHYTFCDKTR